MVNALLIVGFIVLFIGFVLLGIGIYKAYQENNPNTPNTTGKPSDLTGWMFIVAGIFGIFSAIIIFVANYYHGKIPSTKTNRVSTKEVHVE